MPPSCTVRCALAKRRSEPARCRTAPVSGCSQKAWMEMRGTGRSCGAAPNVSSCGDLLMFCSVRALLDDGRGACRLFGCLVEGVLVRLGDFTLLVMIQDRGPARGIHRPLAARTQQVTRIGHHGGDVLLHRATEIPGRLVVERERLILGPVAASLGVGGIGDVADIHPSIAIGGVMGGDQDL